MIDFIINLSAGKGKAVKARAAIEKVLDKNQTPYSFHCTERPKHATEITRKLCDNGADTIIAVGGDGTVHEVLNGITAFENITFGIIPCGTGNDFAASAGLSLKPAEALNTILDGHTAYADFFECGGVRGINAVGTGIDVDILRHYSRAKGTKGKFQYFASLLHCLIHYVPYTLTLEKDGELNEKKAFIACVCNGRQFGGGIKISPESKITDGFLDAVVVSDMPKRKIPGALIKLVGGKISSHPNCERTQIKNFSLSGEFPIQIDGEIYQELDFNVKIIENKLRMFLPLNNN